MLVGGVDFPARGICRGRFSYEGLEDPLDNLAVHLSGRHQYRMPRWPWPFWNFWTIRAFR